VTFPQPVIDLLYLVAAVLFIFGLKGLTHPRTAVRGNLYGSLAMLLAVIATLLAKDFGWGLIAAGLVTGTVIGGYLAVTVAMTGMPELVALFNGFGGAASFLVAGAWLSAGSWKGAGTDEMIATTASGFIGAVTLSGSLVAYAKLREMKFLQSLAIPAQQLVNGLLILISIGLGVLLVDHPAAGGWYWLLVVVSLALGVTGVVSIGGADMPVVIALLNSFSGLAAAATGFVLSNNMLIISGSLVGASGLILTRIMCVAMNRSLANVLFGKLGPTGEGPASDEIYANVKSTSAEEVAMLLEVAQRVVIVPGYGMAVAQAQHAVSDLVRTLTKRDIQVEFGIHPVAGRMPGHMNVLLAEADIPYEMLKEMDVINPTLEQADVAIVLGANDVVNPEARENPNSPIAGMPIINVDKARTCVVIKRSLSPGFAKIANPLFAADNTLMLFADGKQAMIDINAALLEG
jgi:NAD(P) transhydrogenase subunit beta